LPYTGTSDGSDFNEIVDAPFLRVAMKNVIMFSFNRARYDIFTDRESIDFVGGLQYSGLLGSRVTPITKLNDRKVYSIDDDRWSWLLPPTHANDMATVVPIPASAFDEPDNPPDPDPRPQPGFGDATLDAVAEEA